MEGPSVLGPCSWQRRRAWARHSRGCRSPEGERDQEEEEEEEEEEQEAAAVPWEPPEPDRAVLEGRLCCRVRTWLQDCGALQDRHLSPGDSAASGVPSGVPSSSSVAAVLAWWQSQSDAEEILLALGFVGSEPGAASRVPPRFFSGPSRASGIDLGLFLRAQARRLQLEDPCLRLASRFQQFQALAATADAFFCLYSHVSRTPLQRIAPARPCRDIPDSAGRRLKRAVSSLCLYTGRGHGGDTPRGATPGPGGTPEGSRGHGDTDAVSPRPPRAGTAWGHPERCCPHGRGVWGRGGDTGDPRGDVTASCRVAVTAQRPPGLRPPGQPGLGSQCHPGDTARAGGHRDGRVPEPPEPRGAAESFELEEEEEEDEDDDEEDADEADEDEDEETMRMVGRMRMRIMRIRMRMRSRGGAGPGGAGGGQRGHLPPPRARHARARPSHAWGHEEGPLSPLSRQR
ncbi:protein TESPA1 [Melozone crissalis]|uniref:protein TESPA1 n=1 Tax=Melozone crissalis TaxID=40204 RepID=UPI0023DCE6E3|nr:protein TESPA1 [Melozone crissalis]